MKQIIDNILEVFPECTILGISQEEKDLYSIRNFLMEKNWHIIIIPEFYKDGINYNIQIAHYNPASYKEEWKEIDDKSAIVYKDCTDARTLLYGDNGEFSTYLDALKYGIKWCLNIIKTSDTDLV